jgi:hypothetical protein
MADIVLVILGIIIGAAAAWFYASSRNAGVASQLADIKGRGVRTAQYMKDEATARLEQQEAALSDLQSRLEVERQQAAALREAHPQLEQSVGELRSALGALQAELQGSTDQAFEELGQLHEISAALEGVVASFTQTLEAMESRLLASNRRAKDAAGPEPVPPSQVHPLPASQGHPAPPSQAHPVPASQVHPTPPSQAHPPSPPQFRPIAPSHTRPVPPPPGRPRDPGRR